MTATPDENPAGEPEDQDAEPTLNTTDEARPDALDADQGPEDDGGSTEDVI